MHTFLATSFALSFSFYRSRSFSFPSIAFTWFAKPLSFAVLSFTFLAASFLAAFIRTLAAVVPPSSTSMAGKFNPGAAGAVGLPVTFPTAAVADHIRYCIQLIPLGRGF